MEAEMKEDPGIEGYPTEWVINVYLGHDSWLQFPLCQYQHGNTTVH